jgi:hypothetical protein
MKTLLSLPEPPLIGMVAYKLTFRTPEYPDGREVMLVGNDITHRIGSFGPREDLLFLKVPFVYWCRHCSHAQTLQRPPNFPENSAFPAFTSLLTQVLESD